MSSLYGLKGGIKVLKPTAQFFRFFSSRRACPSPSLNVKPQELVEEEEGNAFYVVRKGSNVGLYKSLSNCQNQVSSSICDPPVSVYKGFSLKKETEEYFASCGLKNALYLLNAKALKEDLFGILVPCPFQEPVVTNHVSGLPEKKSLIADEPLKEHLKLDCSDEEKPISDNSMSCTVKFDGAIEKRTYGKGGAGAILRTEDGSVICRLREGLGVVTHADAVHRALILGLKHALVKGFKHIHVQGDSKLAYMQLQGLKKTRKKNIADLCKEVEEFKDLFLSFRISHIKREENSDADAQANLAIALPVGEVREEPGEVC